MKTLMIAIALLICMPGCAYKWDTSYKVKIDPTLSVVQQDEVLSAMSNWRAVVTDTLVFTPSIETCGSAGIGEICVHASTGAEVDARLGLAAHTLGGGNAIGDTDQGHNSADIYLPLDLIAADIGDDMNAGGALFQQVVSHELGHSMGLSHTGPGTIMCAAVSCASLVPECEDGNQYASIRNGFEVACPVGVVSEEAAKVEQ